MNQLTKEIQESIQKNLPAQAAGEMKKFIDEANKQKEDLEKLQAQYDRDQFKLKKLIEKEQAFNTAEARNREADEKIKAAEDKEFQVEMRFKDEQIKQREYVIGQFYSALGLISKNPRAVEIMTATNSQNQQPYYNGGTTVHPPPIFNTETKTTESKETKNDYGLQPE